MYRFRPSEKGTHRGLEGSRTSEDTLRAGDIEISPGSYILGSSPAKFCPVVLRSPTHLQPSARQPRACGSTPALRARTWRPLRLVHIFR